MSDNNVNGNDQAAFAENFKITLQKIYEKASVDQEFRTLCLTDSLEAYKVIVGKVAPPDLAFKLVEDPKDQCFKLPDLDPQDISDEEIDEMAPENPIMKLYIKAASNPKFRELCLKNPIRAFSEISGENIPPDTPIRFTENASEQAFLLPVFKEQ